MASRALSEQLLETVSGSGGDELNDCVLSQPEPPERVEGKAAFQVLLVGACNEDQPAHPGHLTARAKRSASVTKAARVASSNDDV